MDNWNNYPLTFKYRLLTKRLDDLRTGKSKHFKEVVRYITYQESMFSKITSDDRVDHILGCFEIAKELAKYLDSRNHIAKLIMNIFYKNKGYSNLRIAISIAELALSQRDNSTI